MSFQPSIIGTGLVGWQFLKATQERQAEIFNASPAIQRDTDYFRENIARVQSAADLVDDRRLLRVALGAYGLQDDIDSKFFIRKVLEEGVNERTALANRLSDDRYKSLSAAFSFDSGTPPVQSSTFVNDIISRFQEQQFEIAIGQQDQDLRLASNFDRAIREIADSSTSEDARWSRIMGTPPLRQVFEKALNLPSSFAQIDIDSQLDIFKDKAAARFGTDKISEIAGDGLTEKVVQTFLLNSQIESFAKTSGSQVALTLLQSIPRERF